jgi:serine/threonine protein kinase
MASIEHRDPLLGCILGGRYLLIQQVAQGGFGAIYEAEHTTLQTTVIIKVLRQHLNEHPQDVERFRREARVISKLSHPHSLKVYDYGETPEGTLWIAMEKLSGQTLEQYLSTNKKMTEHEVTSLLRDVCEVLEEAHQKGIVHRDLSPKNLFLVSRPEGGFVVKVLDFGLASFQEKGKLTMTVEVSGSPPYMAPEQWDGLKFASARSDLYSLGVIAYQCLTGKLPFDADSLYSWLKKHKEEPAPRLQAPTSAAMQATVQRALSKNPSHRPESAAALLGLLSAKPRKNRATLALSALSATLFVGLIAYSLSQKSEAKPPLTAKSLPHITPSPASTPAPTSPAKRPIARDPQTIPTSNTTTSPTLSQPARRPTPKKQIPTTQMLLDGEWIKP